MLLTPCPSFTPQIRLLHLPPLPAHVSCPARNARCSRSWPSPIPLPGEAQPLPRLLPHYHPGCLLLSLLRPFLCSAASSTSPGTGCQQLLPDFLPLFAFKLATLQAPGPGGPPAHPLPALRGWRKAAKAGHVLSSTSGDLHPARAAFDPCQEKSGKPSAPQHQQGRWRCQWGELHRHREQREGRRLASAGAKPFRSEGPARGKTWMCCSLLATKQFWGPWCLGILFDAPAPSRPGHPFGAHTFLVHPVDEGEGWVGTGMGNADRKWKGTNTGSRWAVLGRKKPRWEGSEISLVKNRS